jgi:hypothetical protein
MMRPLSTLGLRIAAVISLAAIGGLAVAQDSGAGANSADANRRTGPAVRGGARGGGGLAGTGADLGAGTPAATLARPTTPSKAPDPMGFIQRWMVLEPIPASGLADSAVRAAVAKEYFPDQLAVVPRDGDKVSVNGQELVWHAEDTTRYNLNLFHFARALRKPSGNVLFWIVSVVDCPDEVKDARLAVGSNAASVWWVNGKEVVALYGDRQTVIDDGVSRRLTLNKGHNVVRGAVINAFGATDFCARFLDAQDKPLTAITIVLETPAAGAAAAGTSSQKEQP